MKRERLFRVIRWTESPVEPCLRYALDCPHCGAESILPVAPGSRIIAATGLDVIFDNVEQPRNALPEEVECPVCRYRFEHQIKEGAE